jgi:transcription termination/antitermination protein NusA
MTDAPVDLRAALRQLNQEVGVPMDQLVRTVEQALAFAYKRQFETEGFVQARLAPEEGGLTLTATRTAEDGTQTVTRLPVEDFRRTAAQTARKAVLGLLRSIERQEAQQAFSQRYGELASGLVDRIDGQGAVHVDLGHIEGVMGLEDQVPGEALVPGRPLSFVILEGRQVAGQRTPTVRVSRAHRLFLQRMLEAEVPEVAAGIVEVKAIAREAGLRSKVAVASTDPGVDPVGACVGPRGVRHRSLLEDLPGEHVDIVHWSEDPERFVAAALGPAPVIAVEVDPDTRTARVLVPKDHLSLAIGRDGQNARLAAKLTGWRVDIHPAPEPEEGLDAENPA